MARYKRINSGDPLEIPADVWNAMQDAARDCESRNGGAGVNHPGLQSDSGVVYIKNYTGSAISQFAAVGFREGTDLTTYDPPFTPTAALQSFKNTPVINAYVLFRSYNDGDGPHDSRGRFAIALEPIPVQGIGRACISGLCVAQINVIKEKHRYADAVAQGSSLLCSDDRGAAQILWKEAGTGTKWAVLRMGVPAAEPVRHGKITSYTWGASSLTVNPCDWRGYDPDTSETITVAASPSANWAYYPPTKALAVGDVVAFQYLYTDITSPYGKYAVLVDPKIEELIKCQAVSDAILDTDFVGDGHPEKGAQGGYVNVHPYIGGVLNESITIENVLLPAIGCGAPNVREGDDLVIRASDLVCVSPYMDDAIGVIKIWSDSDESIPAGWALCDGENGTIDLSARFVVQIGTCTPAGGYGATYAVGETGGFNYHGKGGEVDENNHNDHEIPNHGITYGNRQTGTSETVANISNTHPDLSHSNTDNRPPYYALCYIQRIN